MQYFSHVTIMWLTYQDMQLKLQWGSTRGVVTIMLDFDIIVREFELHSRFYVHFRTNTFENVMKPLFFYMDKFGVK